MSKLLSGSLKLIALAVLWGAVLYGAAYVLPNCGFNINAGIAPNRDNVLQISIGAGKQVRVYDPMIREPVR